jgi:hypothetical protein
VCAYYCSTYYKAVREVGRRDCPQTRPKTTMAGCVFITAGPIIKLFARGEGDSGEHVLRETTSRGLCGLVCPSRTGTREEPGTLTQGGALFSLVPLVWESNLKLQGGWCKSNHQPIGGSDPNH